MPKHTVIWSDEAKQQSKKIALDILNEWGLSSALSFSDDVDNLVKLLGENNKLCPTSKKVNFRKCVVSKQTSLIYELKGHDIELITLINNRSDHSF